jgi:chaperonin GroES
LSANGCCDEPLAVRQAAAQPGLPQAHAFYQPYYGKTKERRNSMDIRPLHDRIIVERLEEETKTAGGLIIPDTAKEKPQQGKIIAVGKGKKTEDGKVLPLDVKVGDKILFGKYAGTEIKLEGKEFLMMREEDVLGVIEGGKKK